MPGLGLSLGQGPAATIWTPNTAATPAVIWLQATSLGTGSQSTWTDLSTHGNSPTTASTAPINTAASGPRASQPAMVWTAGTAPLILSGNALIGQKNFTMVTVAKSITTAAAGCICASGSNANGFLLGIDVNASTQRDFNANGNTAISDTTNNATTSYEAWIFESDNANALTLSVNNVTHTLSPASALGVAPTATFTVGSNGAGTAVFSGSIFLVIAFATKLGAGDRASLVSYLSTLTGLF